MHNLRKRHDVAFKVRLESSRSPARWFLFVLGLNSFIMYRIWFFERGSKSQLPLLVY